MVRNMKNILIASLLLIATASFGQKNTYKAAGVPYTKTTPNWVPVRGTESEFAIDSLTGGSIPTNLDHGSTLGTGRLRPAPMALRHTRQTRSKG